MKILQKRPLTLIEVCIAFGIIAVCFYIVFSNFQTSSKLITKTEAVTVEISKRQYLMQRLTSVFETVERKSLTLEEKRVGAETVDYLTCVFENGLDRELIFSGIRKAEIELVDAALTLRISSKDGSKTREEVLIDHISSATWDLTTDCVIRLTLTDEEDETLFYAFILPRSADEKVIIEEETS